MPQKPRIRRCHQPPLPFIQIRIQKSMFCTQSGIVGHEGIIYSSGRNVQLILARLLSGLLRISRDDDGLQLDFMGEIDGIRSFEGLRKRALKVPLGDARILVAALADIIKSKKAAGRPRDLAVLPVLEKVLEEATRQQKGPAGSSQERE